MIVKSNSSDPLKTLGLEMVVVLSNESTPPAPSASKVRGRVGLVVPGTRKTTTEV